MARESYGFFIQQLVLAAAAYEHFRLGNCELTVYVYVCVCVCVRSTVYRVVVYKMRNKVSKSLVPTRKAKRNGTFRTPFTLYMSNKMNYSESGNELTYCI